MYWIRTGIGETATSGDLLRTRLSAVPGLFAFQVTHGVQDVPELVTTFLPKSMTHILAIKVEKAPLSFMDYDLGFFDQDENRVEPMGINPFAPKL